MINEQYELVDMSKTDETGNKPKTEANKKSQIKKPIYLHANSNNGWKETKSKKGGRLFSKSINGKWINLGFFKSGHIFMIYDGAFVKDHGLKYTDDKKLFTDAEAVLDTLLIINQ